MSSTVGFIGTGVIAAAMVRALAKNRTQVLVSERNAETAGELASLYDTVSIRSNQGVVDGADVVIICLMDDVARQVLPRLQFRPSVQVFFSHGQVWQ